MRKCTRFFAIARCPWSNIGSEKGLCLFNWIKLRPLFENNLVQIKLVGTYILFGLLGTIAIPACAFMLLEDHTFIDAVYFVIISLTTVGIRSSCLNLKCAALVS